jgi:hypothetical protein
MSYGPTYARTRPSHTGQRCAPSPAIHPVTRNTSQPGHQLHRRTTEWENAAIWDILHLRPPAERAPATSASLSCRPRERGRHRDLAPTMMNTGPATRYRDTPHTARGIPLSSNPTPVEAGIDGCCVINTSRHDDVPVRSLDRGAGDTCLRGPRSRGWTSFTLRGRFPAAAPPRPCRRSNHTEVEDPR